MLTAQGCAARRERLWRALPAQCDLLVVGDPSHLIYLAGYAPSPFVFRTVESGALLLLEPGRATLVADDMLGPFLDRGLRRRGGRPGLVRRQPLGPASPAASSSNRPSTAWRRCRGNRIGVELSSVPAGVVEGLRAARPGLEIVDIAPIIRPLRRAKDADEIEVLRRSMRAGEAGQAAALEQIKPGMTELDAYLIVQNAAMMELGEPAIVYGDFASGPRCETEKGGPPTSRKIEPGDLLLLDFSVVVSGYRGDFTNTFAVGGGPTPRQRELFEACVGCPACGRGQPESRARPPATSTPPFADTSHRSARPRLHQPFGPRARPRPPRAPLLRPRERRHARGRRRRRPRARLVRRRRRRHALRAELPDHRDGFETLSNHEIRIAQ